MHDFSRVKRFTSNGVYFDTSSKADCMGSGNNRRHAEYRAEVRVYGRRVRKRFKTYSDAQDWIAKMRSDVFNGFVPQTVKEK